jgi:hypothetical protein
MKITKKWLIKKDACEEGLYWFLAQDETDGIKLVQKLMLESHFVWANWLIVRLMKYKQYVSYAVYCAEQVIDIYEKEHPEDDRPRQAIEAAKKCIECKSKKNMVAAVAAAVAASVAAAASAAASAAVAADAFAAVAAAAAASAAARSAFASAAADAAVSAADASAAAYAYRKILKKKIIDYGIELLEVNNETSTKTNK